MAWHKSLNLFDNHGYYRYICYFFEGYAMSDSRWAERKALQRAMPAMKKCARCGSTKNLQRHHVSYKNNKRGIVLCQHCHAALHNKRGDWGKEGKAPPPGQ